MNRLDRPEVHDLVRIERARQRSDLIGRGSGDGGHDRDNYHPDDVEGENASRLQV